MILLSSELGFCSLFDLKQIGALSIERRISRIYSQIQFYDNLDVLHLLDASSYLIY